MALGDDGVRCWSRGGCAGGGVARKKAPPRQPQARDPGEPGRSERPARGSTTGRFEREACTHLRPSRASETPVRGGGARASGGAPLSRAAGETDRGGDAAEQGDGIPNSGNRLGRGIVSEDSNSVAGTQSLCSVARSAPAAASAGTRSGCGVPRMEPIGKGGGLAQRTRAGGETTGAHEGSAEVLVGTTGNSPQKDWNPETRRGSDTKLGAGATRNSTNRAAVPISKSQANTRIRISE